MQDIFIVEANERLRILRQQITLFSAGESISLPVQIAIEIHALAGSSATVGNQVMQRLALVLEQIINHAISLAPNEHHHLLPGLFNALAKLEQQFNTHCDDTVPDQYSTANLLIQSSHEVVTSPALEQMDPIQGSHLPAPLQDNISVSGDEFIHSHDMAMKISSLTDEDTSVQPHELVDEELRLIFAQEASELLPQLQSLIARWYDMPEDLSFSANILRLLHILKGSARMAGEFDLGSFLHELEHSVS